MYIPAEVEVLREENARLRAELQEAKQRVSIVLETISQAVFDEMPRERILFAIDRRLAAAGLAKGQGE